MIKTGEYVHGSAAEKIQYDVYQQNKVLQQKKKHRSYAKIKTKAVFVVIFIFILGMFTMYRYAQITQVTYAIKKTNKIYSVLENDNIRLKLEIERTTDLQKVKEVAENKLGMQKPDRLQTVYINVPKVDYTKISEKYIATNEATGALGSVIDKFGKLTRLLY